MEKIQMTTPIVEMDGDDKLPFPQHESGTVWLEP